MTRCRFISYSINEPHGPVVKVRERFVGTEAGLEQRHGDIKEEVKEWASGRKDRFEKKGVGGHEGASSGIFVEGGQALLFQ